MGYASRLRLQALYMNPPKAKVDHTLVDGQELSFFGGIQVIFTPGHTPGHISYILMKARRLSWEMHGLK